MTTGGYNFLYGVTSISAPEFLAGIFAGSLKVGRCIYVWV